MNGRLQNELLIERSNDEKVATLPDFVRRWYINMKASKKTGATCRDYINKVERYLKSINSYPSKVQLSDINEETVAAYYMSVQRTERNGELVYTSDSYQQTVWCCLDNFLGYLHNVGLIERNYIESITKPKNRDLERINENRVLLTEKDFQKILNAVKHEENELFRKRDFAIILLFMNTGMRKTALRTITFDDLDLNKGKLTVIDKGNKRHVYILNDQLRNAIREWINVREEFHPGDDNHIFISSRGNVMSPKTVENTICKYTEIALGKSLTPHKLRSGYCSILYKKTGDIEFVRRCVGHANTVTTQRYIVTKGSEKYEAAEIMKTLLT